MRLTTERGTAAVLHDLGGVGPEAGPAVLICHATGFCGQAYQRLAQQLGSRARVWGLDFPGHGEAPAPADGDFDWRRWTAVVAAAVAAIQATGAAEVHAVGHSMGGAVALAAEAERPGLFASAYLYEPVITPAPGPASGTNALAGGARRRRAQFPSRAAALWRYASRPPLGDLTAQALAAYIEHGFADLPDGTVTLRCLPEHEALTFEASGRITYETVATAKLPALIAVGAAEPVVPPAAFAPGLAATLPAARLTSHAHLGHFGPLQAPAVIAAEILRHILDRQPPSSPAEEDDAQVKAATDYMHELAGRTSGPAEAFGLIEPPPLASATVTRDELLRLDAARQQAGWARAQVLLLDAAGRTPVERPAPPVGRRPGELGAASDAPVRLITRDATELGDAPPPDAVLLGEADGVLYWALRAEPAEPAGNSRWLSLFAVGGDLAPLDAALLTTAVGLLTWHDRARFCARDGSPTRATKAGWARECAAEDHEEFPRTDPAIICLVHDGADQVLLARQTTWPAGQFSVLAGFVEAGESLEACVAREIAEEVGVDVRDVGYLGSQAWPFPRSLMLGFQAIADPAQPIRLDGAEIAEARWLRRGDLVEALRRGDWGVPADDGQLLLPGRMSIARTMIESWVAAG
jgi:NAD+ diphosphatase